MVFMLILNDVYKHVDSSLSPKLGLSLQSFWLSSDGHLVSVKNQDSVIGYLPGSGDDPKALAAANAINPYTIEKLKDAGYVSDLVNSATSTDNTYFCMVRQAFVSRDGFTRCVVYPSVNILAWGIDCIVSKDIEAAYDKEKPFLGAFGNPTDVALIPTIQGNFAYVAITNGLVGDFAIVEHANGSWNIVYRGQHPPPCALMREKKVPESIYQRCE